MDRPNACERTGEVEGSVLPEFDLFGLLLETGFDMENPCGDRPTLKETARKLV